jgi:TM2 domain-containing membrane protein YozV
MRNKTVAALLALFFGGLGIHKFYLGQHGWGIAYLLFFWTLIPALFSFFECIRFFMISDQAFNEKFNRG